MTYSTASEATLHSVDTTMLDWRTQLDLAVTSTDEDAIWQIMAEQYENEAAHETLASMISRLAYQTNNQNVYCELYMLPVVADAACAVINNLKAWRSVSQSIRTALTSWFGAGADNTVFENVMPMDWITSWRPKVLRDYLLRIVPGNEKIKSGFDVQDIALPANAPRLGFLLIARSSRRRWPAAPAANTLADQRLKDVIKYALQIAAPTPSGFEAPAPMVLTPGRVQSAMAEGIALWLRRLHEVVGIKGWMVYPVPGNPDVVKITMGLDSQDVDLTQFTVRMHQLGMQGLNEVVTMLSSLAPCMEIPSDMDEQLSSKHGKPLDN